MKIANEYHGDNYVGVIYDGKQYYDLLRRSQESLESDMRDLTKAKDARIVAKFHGINLEGSMIIEAAVIDLNEGNEFDLEKVLEEYG